MKKVIILSLVLLTGIPISCYKNSGGGIYRIESFALAVGTFLKSGDLSSFRERVFYLPPRDTLSYSDLAIQVSVTETSIVASTEPFSFTTSAFADAIPSRAESKISLISIYASQPVFAGGTEYEAGSNLTNLFLASSRYLGTAPILKFLERVKEQLGDDTLFFYLTLNTPLDEPLSQTLLIDITLENGTVFSLESAHIVIK